MPFTHYIWKYQQQKTHIMALDNLISLSFSKSDLETIDKAIQDIQTVLVGKTINLTPDQRQQYGRIAEQNKLFVNKAKAIWNNTHSMFRDFWTKQNSTGIISPESK
jgi:hypothetical protein